MNDVTTILAAVKDGDLQATEMLMPLVYDELRALAAAKMAHEQPGQTLNPTALVHEAFLRLVKDDDQQKWETAGHFFAAAAEAMRRILVEVARRKGRIKHGGKRRKIDLASRSVACDTTSAQWADELLDLDAVLARFSLNHPVEANVVKLRYFAGLTMQDTANALGISRRTAQRNWAFAKAWLYDRMSSGINDTGEEC